MSGLVILIAAGTVGAHAAKFKAGAPLWTARSAISGSGWQATVADSTRVYTTGFGKDDYQTAAFDAATGAEVWSASYDGPAHGEDEAQAIALSADDSTVYVGGVSQAATLDANHDYALVAYDTVTGAQRWAARYEYPGDGWDILQAIAVSPDSTRVYVTGISSSDMVTIAYDGATGAQLWLARYAGAGNVYDAGSAIQVSPDGTRVYAVGATNVSPREAVVTVAYDAATGAKRWTKLYAGTVDQADQGRGVAVSPDGTRVFVLGQTFRPAPTFGRYAYLTLSYSATNGALQWRRHYWGRALNSNPMAVRVNPNGSAVYITGWTEMPGEGFNYATLAYDQATGATLWRRLYDGPGTPGPGGTANGIAVKPDGSEVYVTGISSLPGAPTGSDWLTVAYGADGAKLWTRRYDGPGHGGDFAFTDTVSADGTKVFVVGGSQDESKTFEATAVGYSTG